MSAESIRRALRHDWETPAESDLNLAAIIDTIPTTAWTTRPDGYCDFISQVWLDYAGMSAEQARGWGWAEAIHPDDRQKHVEHWQSCLESGSPVDTEARIRRFDGSYRCFLIRANPLRDEAGNIVKWYGTCIDIEDRKRREEVLRASELSWRQIIDNIPGLVNASGASGDPTFFNRQELEYFGKTSEELKGWGRIGVIHPEDLPGVIEAWATSIETGQILDIEARFRRADGVYRWFKMRAVPVRDAEGKISDWYALHTDIEERKRAEEKLKRAEDLRLEERVNERTRIARELHDTLLQSVQGLLMQLSAVRYLIRSRPGDAEALLDRMVERAREAVAEGRDAVQGLRSSIDVSKDLVRAITALGEALLNDANPPEFRVTIEGMVRDLPPLVCDEVHRIAGEALRNAFRHASAARIEVQIHYDVGEFRLRVRDNGKGIESSVRDAGRRIGHHGLPGMRERAELVGGKLIIRSEPDSGTEIEFTISAALAYIDTSQAYPENTPIAKGSSFADRHAPRAASIG